MNNKILEEGKKCPWRPDEYKYGEGIIGLHTEIEQFYLYCLPTPIEFAVRNYVVMRIESVVLTLWPNARLEVFGSMRTGLLLPTSDIDIVLIGLWDKLPLYTLKNQLIAEGIAEPSAIKVLDKAVIPIIKLTDRESKLKVDISFNLESGIQSAELIKEMKQRYPVLAKLVLVLKQFILQRDLNEVFAGGISSYSLILMCISFLQLHSRIIDSESNLGVLLLEFFDLYGRKFNYLRTGINIKNGGSYIDKNKLVDITNNRIKNSILYIEDPITEGNNIARSSHAMLQVKEAFTYGYLALSQDVVLHDFNFQKKDSILGKIINISNDVIEYRQWLKDKFECRLISNQPQIENEDASTDRSVELIIVDVNNEESSNLATRPENINRDEDEFNRNESNINRTTSTNTTEHSDSITVSGSDINLESRNIN